MRIESALKVGVAMLLALPCIAGAQELTIAGSTTVQKRILEPGAAALKAATGLDVKVQGVGTGRGMLTLFEGKVPAAAASESLEEAVASAQKAAKELEKTVQVPANLQFHELAKDNIVVIVNRKNPVTTLSHAQLKDLCTGKVKNWKEVGGPDLPVKVVTSHAGSATRAVFQKVVMDGADYSPAAVEVRTTREESNEVATDAGAIGAVSEAFFKQYGDKIKTLKVAPIVRPLALVTVGPPSPEVKKALQFYRSAEGKKLMQ